MFNDSMLDGVSEFKHTPFTAGDVIAHVYFRLVTGAGDDYIVLRTSYAE